MLLTTFSEGTAGRTKIVLKCDDCGKEWVSIVKNYKNSIIRKKTGKDLCKSCRAKGPLNHFYKKKHTIESRRKIKENHFDISGTNHPMYGKRRSEKTKEAISRAQMGKKCPHITKRMKGKTYKEIYGKKEADIRLKKRISMIKYISNKKGTQIFPNWSKRGCEYFKKFDRLNNTIGQYATNGGEYYTEELGYWVDYINFDKKLIMEWDEERHYKDGKLLEKDVRRQKEIEKYFPDFKFIRIRERDFSFH